jgi:pSer/pThr/pTyr-binding forkhead associated (FHA) protein
VVLEAGGVSVTGSRADSGCGAWLIEVDGRATLPLPAKPEITVGRCDQRKGIFPDVDLTSLDPYRFVSRRHASILRSEQGRFTVIDRYGTLNGTYLNGLRLPVNMPAPLRFGDLVVFGLTGFRFQGSAEEPDEEPSGQTTRQTAPPTDQGPPPVSVLSDPAAQGSSFAFGLNENIEVDDHLYHAQTEDLGWSHKRVLTVVYEAGSIVFSRETPYSFFWDRHGREFMPAQMVRFQHRGITSGLRRGRLLNEPVAVGRSAG